VRIPRRSRSHRSPAYRLLLTALAAALAIGLWTASVAKPGRSDDSIPLSTLNFVDADVDAVARAIAMLLGRPIVVDPRVKGKVTLFTEQGVSNAQAYALFLGSLRGLGFAAVETNGLIKIVPEAEAKLLAGETSATVGARHGDQVETRVFRLLHENAGNLVPVLRPLISPNNTINVNAGNNSIVITDYADNMTRLGTLIAALDTPSATDVEVMPVHHGTASDLAATVLRLTDGASASPVPGAAATGGASPAGGAALSIVADPNLNALLVKAPNPARLAEIRALVAQLDRPGGGGIAGGNIHVIYLKNAEATRLATVLRAASANDAGRAALSGSAAAGASAGGGAIAPSPVSSAQSAGATSSNSTQSTTPVSATAQPSTGGYIQADPATNSLIITAPEVLFQELRAVVELLDTRRAQLYVESLVVEVDATRAIDVGLQWKQIFSISQSTLSTLTLGDVAEALQSMSGTNILSTANVVTLDNEEAKIVVGQNVPFVTGSYTTSGSNTASPFQTVERKDVGITLRIRPQIGQNGNIRMTILQESSSVSSTTTPGTTNAGPTTNKRSIESTVVVNDGKIIVLGGLIEDSYDSEAGQVPVLSEIPFVGGLFRYLTRTRKKTNLVVFLRPHVMPDESTTDTLSMDRYDFIRARQLEHPADVRQVLPENDMPALPPLGSSAVDAPERPR
jgi:general secretion pathway protein D